MKLLWHYPPNESTIPEYIFETSKCTELVSLTLNVIWEFPMYCLVCLQGLLIVSTSPMTASHHQVPLDLGWPERRRIAVKMKLVLTNNAVSIPH